RATAWPSLDIRSPLVMLTSWSAAGSKPICAGAENRSFAPLTITSTVKLEPLAGDTTGGLNRKLVLPDGGLTGVPDGACGCVAGAVAAGGCGIGVWGA